SLEFLNHLFGVFSVDVSGFQTQLLEMLLLTVRQMPNASLYQVWKLLQVGPKDPAYAPYVQQLDEDERYFWNNEYTPARFAETRPALLSRLRMVVRNPYLGPILTSPETKLDINSLLDSGKFVCIDNNHQRFGKLGSEFFARMFLAMIYYGTRGTQRSKPVY